MTKLAAAAALLALLAAARPAAAADLSVRPAATLGTPALSLGAGDGAVAAPKATTLFGLPKNVGPWDRALRVAVAATLVGVGAYRLDQGSPNKGLSWAMIGVAAIPAATAATGYCPLYQLLGIDNSF